MTNPVTVWNWKEDTFLSDVMPFLKTKNIDINGIVHIGAHICEEKEEYNKIGVSDENIVWIEGNPRFCEENQKRGLRNVFNAVISDREKDVSFYITNNGASSSLFPLNPLRENYKYIQETESKRFTAISIKTFFQKYDLRPSDYNCWVLDIQGGELDALNGAGELLDNVDVVQCEINYEQLYKDIPHADVVIRFLWSKGFQMTHLKKVNDSWGDALFIQKRYLNQ